MVPDGVVGCSVESIAENGAYIPIVSVLRRKKMAFANEMVKISDSIFFVLTA